MKSRLIKILPGILLIAIMVAITACTGTFAEQEIERGFTTTYPSQFLTGDVYILKDHEKIDGNIAGIGTTLIIEDGATVLGDISLIGGNLQVDGRVTGDINVFAGTASIGETAIITGSINQILNQTTTNPKALIGGEINTYVIPFNTESNIGKNFLNVMEWMKPSVWVALQLGRILFLVLASLLAISLFTKPTFKVITSIRKNLAVSWGVGILTMFSVPIISLVLIVTICLSPIGIILALALLVGSLWSWAALSNIVGGQFTKWLKLEWNKEGTAILGAVFTGIFISFISLIPLVGFLINSIICAIGLGGILLSRFGTNAS
jgi:hypothetical protein